MWVPVVVVVVEGSRQCAFWVVEFFLSTPNKICALWLKYLVFVHLLFLYSTTAVCVHFNFWQKIIIRARSDFFCSTAGTKCVHQKFRKNQKKTPNAHPGLVPVERSTGTFFFTKILFFAIWVRSLAQ